MQDITPMETVRMISIMLYLQEKLKMFQHMVELYESFICNDDIMKKCNPFCLYYLIEIAKSHPKLRDIHRYQSDQMSDLKDRYLKMRLEIRKHFLMNPCFQVFKGLSPASAIDNEWVETVGHF